MLLEEQKHRELKDEYGIVAKQHASLRDIVRRTHKLIVDAQERLVDDDAVTKTAACYSGSLGMDLRKVGEQMYVDVQRYMEVERRLLELHQAISQSRRRVISLNHKHAKMKQ